MSTRHKPLLVLESINSYDSPQSRFAASDGAAALHDTLTTDNNTKVKASSASNVSSKEQRLPQYRILVIGNRQVGKKSLAHVYCTQKMPNSNESAVLSQFSTHGHDIQRLSRTINANGQLLRIEVCETPASVSRPEQLIDEYFDNVHAMMLVFATDDKESFEALPKWYHACRELDNDRGTPCVFVENKIDLVDSTVLDAEHVEALAKQHKFRLYRTSALEGFNVDEAFAYLVSKAMKAFPVEELIQQRTGSAASISGVRSTSSAGSRRSNSAEPVKRRTGGRKNSLRRAAASIDRRINMASHDAQEKCAVM